MIHRRIVLLASLVATAASVSGFAIGVFHARHATAATSTPVTASASAAGLLADGAAREVLVAEVKAQLVNEMGLLPVSVLRDRRSSFVELYTTDKNGKTHYGTAGYLGDGYFITVKHAVVALPGGEGPSSPITSIRVVYNDKEIPAKVVDTGDADVEVHRGDWAIIRSREVDLPPLHVDSAFAFDFADPVFRLGNDYSRGIILSTGYVGQRTSNGLVTCLIDGHPGVSGGGVLDRHGDLVGIPIGRLEGDYRFSFLLPVRAEMFRKVPALAQSLAATP
jgi:Trypsin-like peptidase domain